MPSSPRQLLDSMLDRRTPKDVEVRAEAPPPVGDPTLGIEVAVNRDGRRRNRLVTIGDSLTYGFQSGAIFNTDLRLAWPTIVAWELGCDHQVRRPTYPGYG